MDECQGEGEQPPCHSKPVPNHIHTRSQASHLSLSLSKQIAGSPQHRAKRRHTRRTPRGPARSLSSHCSPLPFPPTPPTKSVRFFFVLCSRTHAHQPPPTHTKSEQGIAHNPHTHTHQKKKGKQGGECIFISKKRGGQPAKKKGRGEEGKKRASARGAALSHPPPPLFILFTRTAASSRGPGSRCDGPSRRRSCT